MARRKRGVLDDGDDSDSSINSDVPEVDFDNDPDAREERALFENPYKNKRRKKNGKEDALYGIFAEDSDDEGYKRKAGPSTAKRSDWTKAPAFVTSDKPVQMDDGMEVESDEELAQEANDSEGDDSEGEDEAGEDVENSDESESSRAPSPRVMEGEEPDDRPRFGGIGSTLNAPVPSFAKGGIGSTATFSRGGIGSSTTTSATTFSFGGDLRSSTTASSRGGIGSSPSTSATLLSQGGTGSDSQTTNIPPRSTSANDSSYTPVGTPSAFAGKSFSGFNPPSKPATPLPPKELAHFGKLKGSFGARMLEKMGWQAGTGLGVTGEGIVTPIESKLRPQKMGIAFKGFKEKTEQSKLEAKRRGEAVSDDEDDPKVRAIKRKAKEQQQKRSDVWKRPKKVKTKVEHKTYEQIVAEAGENVPSGIGMIIDATGAVPREVSSLTDISLNNWSPSNDPTRIPEVRHNIRLIADACKTDLDGLAREAKALQERKKFVDGEDARLRKKVEDEAELIARLQKVQLVANDISSTARELSSSYEVSLEPFAPHFQKLMTDYMNEYERYRLDEIVVAAIAPVMKRIIAGWNPLEDPSLFLSIFRAWRPALKINEEDKSLGNQVDIYGSSTVSVPVEIIKPMTPFESLLWNNWLPKVRSVINNEWSPEEPQPVIKLYEMWSSFLPPFIRDNLLDQLILPKVKKTVAEWNEKQANASLRAIVFPWLPHVGLRLEDILGDARRKIKNLLRSWLVESPIPMDLGSWREVFDVKEWDAMMLKYIVPKLASCLRNEFRINPRDQKMEPFQRVMSWSQLIRTSIFTQILETEFFPKWLDILYIWLIQPKVSSREVAEWYEKWRIQFPPHLREVERISRGFTRGLQLMNKAMVLGANASAQLQRPDYLSEISALATPTRSGRDSKPPRAAIKTHEITFRSIAEEYAASRNLLFVPAGRVHERSRVPLYRVSQSADGKKGLLVYILDDAVWAPREGATGEGEDFQAISLDTMVSRALQS